jgi:hypothetical protein
MKSLLFSLLLALVSLPAFAQPDGTFGPHKGRVYSYTNYRIEAVGCNEFLEIYIYNKDMQPLNNFGATGDVKFYYQNQTYTSSPLTPFGSDGFTAKIPSTDFSYARLTLTIDGQPITAKFGNECVARVSLKSN